MVDAGEVVRYLSWFVLAASMFVAGLYLKPNELRMALKQYRLLGRALLANAVIMPLIGLGLYFITPMPPSIGTAFLLVIFSFGIPLAANFTKSMRADVSFVTVLIFGLALVSSITMPLFLDLFLPATFSIARSFVFVLLFITLFQLVPLLIGLVFGDSQTIRRLLLRPLAILTAGAAILLIGIVVLIGFVGIAYVGVWPPLAMFVLTLASLGIGWIFGGPTLTNRKVLAVNTALRNFPVGFLMATSIFSDNRIAIGMAIFSMMMILMVFAFSRLISRYGMSIEVEKSRAQSERKQIP
jgi:BASS family bile acid:Na+ symporter